MSGVVVRLDNRCFLLNLVDLVRSDGVEERVDGKQKGNRKINVNQFLYSRCRQSNEALIRADAAFVFFGNEACVVGEKDDQRYQSGNAERVRAVPEKCCPAAFHPSGVTSIG